jgi:fermentation-respiration switch protein FrsA (DUF1100 family)
MLSKGIKMMFKEMIYILLIIFVFLGFLYIRQRSMIYFPEKSMPSRAAFQAEDFEKVSLQTTDNLKLFSWYKPAQDNKPTILYLHGNAGHIAYRIPIIRPYVDQGYGVFLLEYRGYGSNPGSPSESGFYKDAQAAIQFLLAKGINSNKIILFGESIGTGVATELALHHHACALILQSPMTSLPAVAKWHYPWLLIAPWDKFNNLKKIEKIDIPILILHGKQDQIVPYQMGASLFMQANEPKQMITIENHGHNDLHNSQYFKSVNNFLKNYCH